MSADTQSILCGFCRVPVEGPANGKSDCVFACPKCGQSDTRENVLKEVKSFVIELTARRLQKSMKKVASGSKFIELRRKQIPKNSYRFVTDHKL